MPKLCSWFHYAFCSFSIPCFLFSDFHLRRHLESDSNILETVCLYFGKLLLPVPKTKESEALKCYKMSRKVSWMSSSCFLTPCTWVKCRRIRSRQIKFHLKPTHVGEICLEPNLIWVQKRIWHVGWGCKNPEATKGICTFLTKTPGVACRLLGWPKPGPVNIGIARKHRPGGLRDISTGPVFSKHCAKEKEPCLGTFWSHWQG